MWLGGSLDGPVIRTGKEYVLAEVQEESAQHYYCYGLYTNKFDFFIAKATLKVSGKSFITNIRIIKINSKYLAT